MACLALGGSPVAAVSMQDAHLLSPAALTMLTGSRLGASCVLFLIGWSDACGEVMGGTA